MQILAPELNDRLLADFLDMESSLIVSMHIQSVDQAVSYTHLVIKQRKYFVELKQRKYLEYPYR